MIDYRPGRLKMVEQQIARRGIGDQAVLTAMGAVPREEFVPEQMRDYAYEDTAVPLAHGQTVSQPYIVALMAAAAELTPDSKVLEIGTGSGYAAAVLAEIAARVITIERLSSLAEAATARLQRLGYANVQVISGDGSGGCGSEAPFDAILSAAGSPEVPEAWKRQLAIGGRLILPLGPPGDQLLIKIVRLGPEQFSQKSLAAVRFVPLVAGQS